MVAYKRKGTNISLLESNTHSYDEYGSSIYPHLNLPHDGEDIIG
jgi:hypothetical protein